MAPLARLLALFALALSTAVLASPHVPRNAYIHAHRAIARQPTDAPPSIDVSIPKRKRSLNKRCVPRPTNSTTSALPISTAPINVAPVPSLTSSSSSSPTPSPPADTTSSTSSSSYVPPPSPTSQAASPSLTTPSPSPSPSPTTSSTAAPAQTSLSSGSSQPSYTIGTVMAGDGTYYSTGLGACGITNNDGQYIAAISYALFDSYPGYNGVNPNTNPVCGRKATATYQGKSVTVTITDRCTGCQPTDLDFSPTAFNTLSDPSAGRISINWEWTS